MPLSAPRPRTPLHTRSITLNGYHRDDGLLDIEAHLVDTKPFDIENQDRGGMIKEGEALHGLWVRLTVDETLLVHEAEAVAEWTPFHYCKSSTESFRKLIGERMAPGWNNRVRELLGGVRGCTHITEMLSQIATTAYQSLYSVRRTRETQDSDERPAILDTCFALSSSGPVVAQHWPKFYRPVQEPSER